MDNPVESFYITGIKRHLEQFLYWQMEINEDLLNGDMTSITPCLFMADKLHNMNWYYEATRFRCFIPVRSNIRYPTRI